MLKVKANHYITVVDFMMFVFFSSDVLLLFNIKICGLYSKFSFLCSVSIFMYIKSTLENVFMDSCSISSSSF